MSGKQAPTSPGTKQKVVRRPVWHCDTSQKTRSQAQRLWEKQLSTRAPFFSQTTSTHTCTHTIHTRIWCPIRIRCGIGGPSWGATVSKRRGHHGGQQDGRKCHHHQHPLIRGYTHINACRSKIPCRADETSENFSRYPLHCITETPNPQRASQEKKPQRTCNNCKKAWVTHADAECMKLEANAAKRWPNWKNSLKKDTTGHI